MCRRKYFTKCANFYKCENEIALAIQFSCVSLFYRGCFTSHMHTFLMHSFFHSFSQSVLQSSIHSFHTFISIFLHVVYFVAGSLVLFLFLVIFFALFSFFFLSAMNTVACIYFTLRCIKYCFFFHSTL